MRGAHVAEMHFLQDQAQRLEPDRREDGDEQDRGLRRCCTARRTMAAINRATHHRKRCQICDLQRNPPTRQPEIFSASGESCSIRDEKLRPMSGT